MRSYMILKALFNTKDYLPITFFMEQLEVSKRTVQSEFAYLKKVSDKHGYLIHIAYGKGYFIEVIDKVAFTQFLDSLTPDDIVTSGEQLISDVLSILLTSTTEYVVVSELSESLGISRSLLYSEMKTISNYLNSYNLKLIRKSHYGICIKGEARYVRQLMLDLYLRGDNQFKELTDEKVGQFEEYERLVEDCIRNNNLRIGYYEFQVLIGWLKIFIIFSANRQFSTSENNGVINPESDKVLRHFDIILLQLQERFKVIVTMQDIDEFNYFIQKSVQKNNRIDNHLSQKVFKNELLEFFSAVDVKNRTDYSKDHEFLEQITTHLLFLIDRIDQKITYKNPLLLELCIRYPMVFDIVLKFSTFLKTKFGYDISNDELGFIAVHFLNHTEKEKNKRINQYERIAVICTTGGGVSNLVRTQIMEIFPRVVVKAFSFWEEQDLATFKPDLIFSVVPLKRAPKVPTIYIKELLSNRDIKNIKQVLFLDNPPRSDNTQIDYSQDYLSLLKPNLFSVETIQNYDVLIKKMAEKMMSKGYADDNFQKNVVLREQYMSTVYNNGIAMPHPIEMKGKQSAIAVSVVKPELRVGKRVVRLVFMVCLAKEDFHFYSNISNGLFQLMQDNHKISDIYHKPDLQRIINIFKEMEG